MIPCTTQFLMARTGLNLTLEVVSELTGLPCERLRDLEDGVAGLRPGELAKLISFYQSHGIEFGDDFVRIRNWESLPPGSR